MQRKDLYLKALKGYARNDAQYSALRKAHFVPLTANEEIDEFLLAVKEPEVPLTPRAIAEAMPALEKYIQCKNLPKLYKKSFMRAYEALRTVKHPVSIDDFEDAEKSAIQSYVAMGHPVSGLSLIWDPKEKEFVSFDELHIEAIGDGAYVLP